MIHELGVLLAAITIALLAVACLHRMRGSSGAADELDSRPSALRHADLAYVEQTFRSSRPFRLVARVDRAYRLRQGALVLIELKTRWRNRPFETDIIQLSAQKLAIEEQTGEPVEPYAFVSIVRPVGRRSLRHHRVQLLSPDQLLDLHRRREAILAGRIRPGYALAQAACERCAFRSRCDRPRRDS